MLGKKIAMGVLCAASTSLMSTAVNAQEGAAGPKPATYILQVSTNLACQPLQISVISDSQQDEHTLNFTSGAFAAVTLPAGEYSFKEVRCESADKKANSFTQPLDTLSSITLQQGQAYFGGKLILNKLEADDTPNELDNCPRGMSRARGDVSNDCRDGVGVSGDNMKVNMYAPKVAETSLAKVRAAFNASPEQLVYLPLTPKT